MAEPIGMIGRVARRLRRLADPGQAPPKRQPKSRATPKSTTPKPTTPKSTAAPQRRPSPKGQSAEREALIAEAMRIHRAKRVMLGSLNDEDRILLEVMANQLLIEASGNGHPEPSRESGHEDDPDPQHKDSRDVQSPVDGPQPRPHSVRTQPDRRGP